MRRKLLPTTLLMGLLAGCGSNNSPTSPTPPSTPPPPTSPEFEITTLITVYRSSDADAEWTRGRTTETRIGQILLGVDDLSTAIGSTNLNNEGARNELQATIDRLRNQFTNADYVSAFDETQAKLERYLNDADRDGWSIDGRHGTGRDWPHDGPGNRNDPDGWTAQIVVTVSRP